MRLTRISHGQVPTPARVVGPGRHVLIAISLKARRGCREAFATCSRPGDAGAQSPLSVSRNLPEVHPDVGEAVRLGNEMTAGREVVEGYVSG